MERLNAWDKDFRYVKGKSSLKVWEMTKDLDIAETDYAPFPAADQWGNVKFKSLETLCNSECLKRHKNGYLKDTSEVTQLRPVKMWLEPRWVFIRRMCGDELVQK